MDSQINGLLNCHSHAPERQARSGFDLAAARSMMPPVLRLADHELHSISCFGETSLETPVSLCASYFVTFS